MNPKTLSLILCLTMGCAPSGVFLTDPQLTPSSSGDLPSAVPQTLVFHTSGEETSSQIVRINHESGMKLASFESNIDFLEIEIRDETQNHINLAVRLSDESPKRVFNGEIIINLEGSQDQQVVIGVQGSVRN